MPGGGANAARAGSDVRGCPVDALWGPEPAGGPGKGVFPPPLRLGGLPDALGAFLRS